MRKRTSDYSSDTEPQQPTQRDDIALRCPLAAPATFLDAKIAFDNGGDEVRRFLIQECSLIFECNACRSMFRDLTNFISHKRFYCCVAAPAAPCNGNGKSNGFPDPKSNALIAATAALAVNAVHNGRFSSSSSVESADVGVADVLYDEQQPEQRQVQQEHALSEGQATSRPEESTLDGLIPNNDVEAKTQEAELDVVHSLITKMEHILNTNEPECEPKTTTTETTTTTNTEDQNELMPPNPVPVKIKHPCGMCKLEFQSEKSVKIHMQKKHMGSAHTFKCPSCALTFLQPTAVIRHLATDHKKSVRRIRMTRDTKRRLLSEETQARGAANRELRRLQSTDSNGHVSTRENENIEKKKVMSNCIYCEKSFERRAALSTHLMSCRVKLEALEKPTPIKRPKLQSQQSQHQEELQPESNSIIKDEITNKQEANIVTNEELKKPEPINEPQQQLVIVKTEYDSDDGKVCLESDTNTVSLEQPELPTIGNASEMIPKRETFNDSSESIEHNLVELDAEDQSLNKTDDFSKGDTSESDSANSKNKGKELSCRCKICNKQFNALSNLRRHISMFHYRARKFGCTLCDYRAFRRYDIVNHLGFVHKMTDDREMLATEYVSVHEVHYSKDDMDGDIVVLSNEQKEAGIPPAGEPIVKTYDKRPKRTRTLISNGHAAKLDDSTSADADCKPTRQKLRRAASSLHTSQHESSMSKSQKRPIRNRIKPENKDFVYDLSSLLKDETAAAGVSVAATVVAAESAGGTELRSLKRRNTILNSAGAEFETTRRKSLAPLIGSGCRELVKSSMRRICLLMVSQGRAKLATQPELPAERPQMRPRLTSTCRVDMQAVPVIETSDLEAARRKSTLLGDSFLEKISRRTASEFKIKPCLELEHTALDTLLQKVDSSLQQQHQQQQQLQQKMLQNDIHGTAIVAASFEANDIQTTDFHGLTNIAALTSPSLANCAITQQSALITPNGSSDDDDQPQQQQQFFVSPLPSIPVASTPPSTPRKRITLVQRMAENKAAKQRDSLLRTALEN